MKRPATALLASLRHSFCCALPFVLVTLTGCEEPPPTNTDEILQYVRNGDAGAKVRRLDDAAQQYVDTVFAAYREWESACGDIEAMADHDALWTIDAADWRDRDEVGQMLATIADWKSNVVAAERLTALNAALDAAHRVPAGRVDDVAATAREQLDAVGKTAWLSQVADRYEPLFALALERADAFDPNSGGLTFTDAESTARAERLWNDLHQMLKEARDTELAGIDHTLTVEMDEREAAIIEKQQMRSAGFTDEASQRRFRELEMLLHYYDQRKNTAEARQRALGDDTAE